MPLKRESKIPFVYYCPDWDPRGNEPISVLRDKGIITYLEEYDDDKRGNYYCPGCGVTCYRSPREYDIHSDSDSLHWGHFSGYKDIYCSLRTDQGEQCKSTSEKEKEKAVDDEKLTIIPRWRDISDLASLLKSDQAVNAYSGIAEDENSQLLIGSVNRHTGQENLVSRESGSLFLMGSRIERYLGQDIQFPGSNTPVPFIDVFIHSYDIKGERVNGPIIVWGLIKEIHPSEGYLDFNFEYESHNVIFKIPQEIIKRRFWEDDYLLGNLLMVTGEIEVRENQYLTSNDSSSVKNSWIVRVEYWGQAAIITSSHASNLILRDGRSWEDVSSPVGVERYYDKFRKPRDTRIDKGTTSLKQRIDRFVGNNRATSESLRKYLERDKSNSR
ncbi:MAG: hypothetical protein HC851_19175 [Acaryochloris sp. RU_4_1]|nr:hypothetical protein [Acaryochloris sp. RU_4_1]